MVAVVAPAGYGKTTVLAQWAACRAPRVGWINADARDNDPAVLLTYLAAAVARIEPVDQRVFRQPSSLTAAISEVARLTTSIAAMPEPVVLVIDGAEAITNRECRDVIAELAVRLPPGSQLAIGSRHEPPVPVARLRAHREIVEVGAAELSMDVGEAEALLAAADVDVPDDEVVELLARTEGWAAGLYLGALAAQAGSPRPSARVGFSGDDRFMGDYLRSEFLDRVSRADATFLTRTSILDEVNGSLGDATAGGKGAATVLDRLERRNLLVIPQDRRGDWYRYHTMFRELLHAELFRREPDLVPELHGRAAEWFEQTGQPEVAIRHAQAAGDADRVARLVLQVANPVWASGRVDTVLGWVEWFASRGLVERYPAIAVHGALIYALVGRPGDADRWSSIAERSDTSGRLVDGNTREGTLAYLRALMCRQGLDQMREDADIALAGLAPASPYRPAMLHARGLAELLGGDLDQAESELVRAQDEAASAGVVPFVPVALAERGLVAIDRDDWAQAGDLAAQALTIMQSGEFDDYWTSALVYAWAARVTAHRGDVSTALALAARAARLRPLLTYSLPIVSAQALVELTHVYVSVSDTGGARVTLRQLRDILQQRPQLGRIVAAADELGTELDEGNGTALSGASSLTAAELRLLPLLASHLSLAEIGERFYVSRNTIKTQAISIYRKFGVSSRSETVARMHELGLLQT